MAKILIYANRNVIVNNRRKDLNDPPLTIIFPNGMQKDVHGIKIDGTVEFIYSKENPLPSGKNLWAEVTDGDIKIY